jgi:uncharacterized SAM-binding protein YcdF (DUF218 family)
MHQSNRAQDPPRPAVESAYLLHESQSRSAAPLRQPPKKFFGIVTRRERWGLSWLGWLLVAVATILAAAFTFSNIYSFLAVSQRVNTNVLVVEGWAHRYAIRAAVDEFRAGSYKKVFTTGGPVIGNGGYVNDQQTAASVGAQGLKQAGLPADLVQMVPSHVSDRDRTYSSAVALRGWFRAHNMQVESMNVVTENTHARRTRLLFQKAFGDGVRIGIIAVPTPDYKAKDWWRHSDGVEQVLGESIAYIYARLFFWPGAAKPREKGDGGLPKAESGKADKLKS